MRTIVIREMHYAEAKAKLMAELDDAFLNGESLVHVLHGIGAGALKRMTAEVIEQTEYAFLFPGFDLHANPGITKVRLETASRQIIRRHVHRPPS